MAKFAAFGDTVFSVSSFKVLTFDNFKRTTRHRYAKHEIVNHKPKLESLGEDLVEIEMEIFLLKDLGVNVESECAKLRQMCNEAEVNYLIIGVEVIGLFVIEEMTEEVIRWNGTGDATHLTVHLKLKEYN